MSWKPTTEGPFGPEVARFVHMARSASCGKARASVTMAFSATSLLQGELIVAFIDDLVSRPAYPVAARPHPVAPRLERVAKRILDVLFASVALVMLAVPFVVVAVLIKLDSSGPVFFRHTRVGVHGRSFRMWKFRTMVSDAEARLRELSAAGNVYDAGPFVKIAHDPRITRLGSFLRKTSVDELPQLLNVVTGQMSLVGPRPLIAAEVEALGEAGEERLLVAPGITGLWQISGRSTTTADERLELDLEYVRRRGLVFDLRILLLTIPAVLWGRGAM